jgi:hypothetical protein
MNSKNFHILKWVFAALIVVALGVALFAQRDCHRPIPGADTTVYFPCTWRSKSTTDQESSLYTLQLEPRIPRHGQFGIQVEFIKECASDDDDCDPIETLRAIENSLIAQERLEGLNVLSQFSPPQQLPTQNGEIYYLERARPSLATLILTRRIYAIRSNDRLFLVYSLRYVNAHSGERFDLTTDKIAASIR